MTGIVSVAQLCFRLGAMIVCMILVAYGILHWLAEPEKRGKRLKTAGWVAFAILVTAFFRPEIAHMIETQGDEAGNQRMTFAVINISKITVKLLILGAVMLVTAVMFLVIAVAIIKGIHAIISDENEQIDAWAKRVKQVGDDFKMIIKTPIFTFFVTCGILTLFVILPFLMGSSERGAGLAKTWETGVQEIAQWLVPTENTENTNLAGFLITYIVIFIIVLGVGFAMARILHAIIKDNLKDRDATDIIDEYSGSMGILGVGVSILFAIQSTEEKVFENAWLDTIFRFFKYFVIVAVVMALVIVVLEIIRLLMDMRETLIRIEARYLFIALVGQVSLLVLSMVYTIYSALNSVIGGELNIDIQRIHDKLIQRIIDTMDREIDQEGGSHKMTFTGFKGKVTKK